MLDTIKNILGLDGNKDQSGDPNSHERTIMLATSALLVEAAMMDGEFTTDERRAIAAILQTQYDFSAAEAVELIDDALAHRDDTSAIYKFTRVVKDRFDEAGRIEIIEHLWHVAYADKVLHDFEAHLVRRVAGLLYVPDKESGAARKRVLARLGIAE